MKYCENCGAELEDSAVFCDECGARVETVPQEKAVDSEQLIHQISQLKKENG